MHLRDRDIIEKGEVTIKQELEVEESNAAFDMYDELSDDDPEFMEKDEMAVDMQSEGEVETCNFEFAETEEDKITKKPRGPPPAVPWNTVLEVLKQYDVLDENNKVKTERKHMKMWKTIRKDLKNKIKVHTLQNHVSQDRHNLKTDLIKHKKKEKDNSNVGNAQSNEEKTSTAVEKVSSVNMMNVLLRMQKDIIYKPIIRLFCTYPFTIYYWSTQAIELTQFVPYEMIYAFGTIGNLTQDFCIPNEYRSNTVMSYCLGWALGDSFIPLLQMLSEDNNYTNLKRFFNEALRGDFIAPSKIIIEYSLNSYTATIECFNINYTVPKYVSACFECLINDKSSRTQLPDCQICAEIDGILAKTYSWNYSQNIEADLKLFFGNIFILLGNCETLSEFKSILTKLFVLTLSKLENALTDVYYLEFSSQIESIEKKSNDYDYSRLNDLLIHVPRISPTECPAVQEFLLDVVDDAKVIIEKCIKVSEEVTSLKEQMQVLDSKNFQELLSSESQLTLKNYPEIHRVLSIILDNQEKEENCCDSILNAFYSDSITNNVLETCTDFVTWTKVMNHKFNLNDDGLALSSLSRYGTDFVSSIQLADEPLLTIDEYLQRNISFTASKVEFALSKFEHRVQKKKVSKFAFQKDHENWFNVVQISSEDSDSTSESESFIHECEHEDVQLCHDDYSDESLPANSKHKNVVRSKKKKVGILTEPCPEFSLRAQQPKKRGRKRSVIKNASLMKDLKVGKEIVIYISTSPFDSLTEIVVSSYYLISKFQKFLNDAVVLSDVMQCIKSYASNLQLRSLYAERTKILSRIFTAKKGIKLYWNDTEASFIQRALTPSIQQTISCEDCKCKSTELVSCTEIPSKTLTSASDVIQSITACKLRFCTLCGKKAQVRCNVEHYLFCDIECKRDQSIVHNLYDLPDELVIESKNFILTGAIAFENVFSDDHPDIRHYIAFSRNFQKNWTMYDDRSSYKRLLDRNSAEKQIAILLYIEYEAIKMTGENELKEDSFKCNGTTHADTYDDRISIAGSISREVSIMDYNEEPENAFVDEGSSTSFENILYPAEDSTSMELVKLLNENNSSSNISVHKNDSLTMMSDQYVPACTSTPITKENSANIKISIQPSTIKKFTFKEMENAKVSHSLTTLFDKPITKIDKRTLIPNASRQLGYFTFKLEDVQYKIKFVNSCAVDSIFEVLTEFCINASELQKDIITKKEHNVMLNTIYNYCSKNFDLETLYIYRAKELFIRPYSVKAPDMETQIISYKDNVPTILKNLTSSLDKKPTDFLKVDCRVNVVSLFKELMVTFPSIIEHRRCTNVKCKEEDQVEHFTTSVNMKTFFTVGIQNIERMLHEALNDKNKFCSKCGIKERSLEICYHLQNYLAIELDILFESENEASLSKLLKTDVRKVYINLSNLQTNIVINGKPFELKAAIEFTDEPGILNHYIAYSKHGEKWIKYDDMLCDTEELEGTLPSVKLALLFYIAKP